MKPSFSSEETTNHSTAEIAGEPAGRKGAGRDIGGLAELVAARKGEGIRDGKDDGDDNQTEPNKLESENRNDTQSHPTDRLRVQRQPEESLIRSIDMSGFRVRRLKDPIAVA